MILNGEVISLSSLIVAGNIEHLDNVCWLRESSAEKIEGLISSVTSLCWLRRAVSAWWVQLPQFVMRPWLASIVLSWQGQSLLLA